MAPLVYDIINEVATSISNGRTVDALVSSHKAHEEFKEHMAKATPQILQNTATGNGLGFITAIAIPLLPCSSSDIGCSKAFLLTGNKAMVLSKQYIGLSFAVLKYNYALSLQLQVGPGAEGYQQQAFYQYKQCLQVVQKAECGNCGMELAIACLHNMAILHFNTGAFSEATTTIRYAIEVLKAATDHSQLLSLDEETVRGLVRSGKIIPFCANLINAAPAA